MADRRSRSPIACVAEVLLDLTSQNQLLQQEVSEARAVIFEQRVWEEYRWTKFEGSGGNGLEMNGGQDGTWRMRKRPTSTSAGTPGLTGPARNGKTIKSHRSNDPPLQRIRTCIYHKKC